MEFICTPTEPVVNTEYGKLRGFKKNGIYTFRGIKYADAKRFRKPEKPKAWEGVKDAISYGDVCPIMEEKRNGFGEIRIPHRYWWSSEDCQYINVWTDSLDANAKKPVLIWIHGGGFDTGSSVELICYDGENAARYGDVVLVSLNHRLNCLGFLDLSAYGEEYAGSGTNGLADIVMALEWVRDNITAFGGDPENVTLFGQSGGGGKIQALLQTPAADGLFHKAIIESGIIDFGPHFTAEEGRVNAENLVNALGLTRETIGEIDTMPYSRLCEAYDEVTKPKASTDGWPTRGWSPIPDTYYAGDQRKIGFREHALKVPVILGSCIGEMPAPGYPANRNSLSREEKISLIRQRFGDDTEKAVELFEKAYPGKDLADLYSLDTGFRSPNLEYADKFAAVGGKQWVYLFAYDFPFNDGDPAWHCAELPYVFHNMELSPVCCEEEMGEIMQNRFFGAWMNFCHKGDPNCEYLPAWEPYTVGNEATMVIDRTCELRKDFDRELIALANKAAGNGK